MDILASTSFSENKYLLMITDCFTKWVEAFPLSNIRAIVEVFVNQVISRFGVPLELHTDQERNFESKIPSRELIQMLVLTQMLGIKN